MTLADGKLSARRAWGDSPTGTTAAGGAAPGTREFFERALQWRSDVEQPWLKQCVPFGLWRGKKVLEVGHGPGFDAYTIMTAGARYTGIEITPENIARTRVHLAPYGLEPNVLEGDAEALSFLDGSFDVVYSNGVLHHTPDINAAFREAQRVLKPGGEFYVVVYHRNSIFYWITLGLWYPVRYGFRGVPPLKERLRGIEWNRIGEKPIVNVYSRADVARLLQDAGFEVRSIKVRKLLPADLPQLWYFRKLYDFIPTAVYAAVGKLWGWYVIGVGRVPTRTAAGE